MPITTSIKKLLEFTTDGEGNKDLSKFSSNLSFIIDRMGGDKDVQGIKFVDQEDIDMLNKTYKYASENILPNIKSKESYQPEEYKELLDSLFFVFNKTGLLLRKNSAILDNVVQFQTQLSEKTIEHMNDYPALSLIRTLDAAFKSRTKLSPEFLTKCSSLVADKIEVMNKGAELEYTESLSRNNVSSVLHYIHNQKFPAPDKLVHQVVEYANNNMDRLTAVHAMHIVHSLSVQGPHLYSDFPNGLVKKLIDKVEEGLDGLNYKELTMFPPSNLDKMGIKLYKEWKSGDNNESFIQDIFVEKFAEKFLKSWGETAKKIVDRGWSATQHIEDLILFLKNIDKIGYRPSNEVMLSLEEVAKPNLQYFSTKQLSNFIHKYIGFYRFPQEEFKKDFDKECVDKMKDFAPQGLANIFYCNAKMDYRPDQEWLMAWGKEAVNQMVKGGFKPIELSNSLYSYAKLDLVPPRIFMREWHFTYGNETWNNNLQESEVRVRFSTIDHSVSIVSMAAITETYRKRCKKYPNDMQLKDEAEHFEKTSRSAVAIMIGRIGTDLDFDKRQAVEKAVEVFGFKHIKINMLDNSKAEVQNTNIRRA